MAGRLRKRDKVRKVAKGMIDAIPIVGPDLGVFFMNVVVPRLEKPRDRIIDGIKSLFGFRPGDSP